jgi:hypothetical protein
VAAESHKPYLQVINDWVRTRRLPNVSPLKDHQTLHQTQGQHFNKPGLGQKKIGPIIIIFGMGSCDHGSCNSY